MKKWNSRRLYALLSYSSIALFAIEILFSLFFPKLFIELCIEYNWIVFQYGLMWIPAGIGSMYIRGKLC